MQSALQVIVDKDCKLFPWVDKYFFKWIALDNQNADDVMQVFTQIKAEYGTSVIIATHDERIISGETNVFHM